MSGSATLTQRVTSEIREMLLSGALLPGARLQEIALAERLGVSRTPVRETLSLLRAEGLLEHSPNVGYVVRRISPQDALDQCEVRATLEAMAARVLAERGLPEDALAQIEANLAACERITAGPSWSVAHEAEWSDLNTSFHETLIAATGNRSLAETVQQTRRFPLVHGPESRPHASLLLRQSYGDREHCRRSTNDHRQIVEAILRREGSRSEHLMHEHVYRTRDALRRAIDEMNAQLIAQLIAA